MKMAWMRRGLILSPNDIPVGMSRHAQMPIVDPIAGRRFRLYFTTRDAENRSLPLSGIFKQSEDGVITKESIEAVPLLSLGSSGTFDDSGVMPSSMVIKDGVRYLYYIGWNVPSNVPFRNSIGLATSQDEGATFQKFAEGPVLDRGNTTPYFVTTPHVVIEGGGWRMWFVSGTKWELDGKTGYHRSYYNIRHASSDNGIDWKVSPDVCLDFQPGECAVARPFVLRERGVYKMWFCYRWDKYQIGYAESLDGISWERKDLQGGLPRSESGWDCEMTAYPFVAKLGGKRHLFYNGNQFGQTGIGFAVEKTES